MKPIGLIDGDALRKEYLLAGKNKLSLTAVINRLEMMPTLYPVDAVIVVRCKDCVHKVENDDGLICGNISMGEYGEYVDDNHFCSDGERGDQQCK